MIEAFWNMTILGALNLPPNSPIPPGVLPSYLMDLNWTALGQNGVIVGFSLFVALKAIEPYTITLNLNPSQILLEVFNFVPSLANLTTEQEITGAILTKINNVTQKNFTV
jgi:hypothetical protein